MSIPLFYPPASFVPKLKVAHPVTLERLCVLAGVSCRASGAWTQRLVDVIKGADALTIEAEPGYRGNVRIRVTETAEQSAARVALGALAYGVMDLVARESIKGATWAKPAGPKGRPPLSSALSNAERQRKYRERQRLD